MSYTQVPAATRRELTQSLKTDSIELIDQVQVDYECCGVDNYSDWFNTTWSRDNQGLLAPESCCSKNEIWNNCSSVPDNIYAHVSQSCIRMRVCVCVSVCACIHVCLLCVVNSLYHGVDSLCIGSSIIQRHDFICSGFTTKWASLGHFEP